MKKILVILTVIISSNISFGQNYEFGAMFSGMFVKAEGKISINDTLVTIEVNGSSSTYNRIKSTNQIIYFTDGVTKYSFSEITGKYGSGKKKGYAYTKSLVFSVVEPKNATTVTYYCNEIQ